MFAFVYFMGIHVPCVIFVFLSVSLKSPRRTHQFLVQETDTSQLAPETGRCITHFAGRSGLVVSMSDCGVRGPMSNFTAGGCIYRDGYCDMQPWTWAAPYCSA